MVEISMREIGQGLNVHSLLDDSELLLERVVGTRFNEREDLVTSDFVDCNLLHCEHLWVDARPLLFWHAENLSFR